jgi:hypothetical protein
MRYVFVLFTQCLSFRHYFLVVHDRVVNYFYFFVVFLSCFFFFLLFCLYMICPKWVTGERWSCCSVRTSSKQSDWLISSKIPVQKNQFATFTDAELELQSDQWRNTEEFGLYEESHCTRFEVTSLLT